ncbi:MAG TPA: TetR/AcrR family transcriptional regulator [Acidobacteriaceae bacterium]|jgi:AcrR family transcriptional regulator
MKKSIKPRKMPQQSRSRKTREDILQATALLLNRHPLGEVSTNHIARKTGISIGTLYKYYPNKDSILADLSLEYMQQDAELLEHVFDKYAARPPDELLDALVDALMKLHKEDAQVRGVLYQNLERLKLVSQAQNTRRQILAKGTTLVSRFDPVLTWVAISAVNAAVHAMSQLPKQDQNWSFVKSVCRQTFGLLMAPE